MAADVVFSREARSDLVSIYLWVEAAAGPATAEAYQARLRAACLALTDFPRRGTPRPELGPEIRSIAFERRAVIAYREASGTLEILAIAHRGRDLGQETA
ncbi:MAG: type II toxin-antitoxin system RelE/ParE family toxin [Allosphingosinicella sp.]